MPVNMHSMWRRLAVAIGLVALVAVLTAMHGETELLLQRPCLRNIALAPDTECSGPDLKHMTCSHIRITYLHACEILRVKH